MKQPKLKNIDVKVRGGDLVITPIWMAVDRPGDSSYNLGAATDKTKVLAARFVRALESGKIWFEPPEVRTDTAGKTYVSAHPSVRMRALNADLRAAGF